MSDLIERILGADALKTLGNAIPVLLVILVCLIAIKVIMKIVSGAVKKSKLDKGLHGLIERVTKAVLYFIAILVIADMLGIPVSSLLATFSIVGLAASLAIQDTLSNIASGITIFVTHIFRIGNYIDVNGTSGTVKDINFTHTILQTPDNRIIHLPNKQVIDATITNYSEMPKRRVDLTFNVSYDANAEKVKSVIRSVIDKNERILKDEGIFVRTTNYAASGIDYTLRVWVKSEDYWTIYFDLMEDVKKALDENGIEIPYNQLDVRIHNK